MPAKLEIFLFQGFDKFSLRNEAYSLLFKHLGKLSESVSEFAQSGGGEINLIFGDGRTIRALNRRFRGVDSATDVLAFPFEGVATGEVWLCPNVIKANAAKFTTAYEQELIRIAVHGILHILGFDHSKPFESSATSREKMYIIQEKIVKRILE